MIRATKPVPMHGILEGDIFTVGGTVIAPGGYEMRRIKRLSDFRTLLVRQELVSGDSFEHVDDSEVADEYVGTLLWSFHGQKQAY